MDGWGNGCAMFELSESRADVRPWAEQGRVALRVASLKRKANGLPPAPVGSCAQIAPKLSKALAPTRARRGKCAAHGEGETPAQGGKPSAYPPSDSESRSDALAGVQICRQANLSENRRARFGQLRCPRLARSAGSSANHAKRIGRTQPRRARGGACALDNLGTICAQLPTGAGESPFASRFRVA